jgi:hypothetical protein
MDEKKRGGGAYLTMKGKALRRWFLSVMRNSRL